MKKLLAYLPALCIFFALLLIFASCATPQRCAKYCTGTDSTTVTVHDTVVQVQIVPDSASATASAPCPDIAPVIVATDNARARAWIADSTLHVDVSQFGTAPAMVEYRDVETIRYRYITIPCDEKPMLKYFALLLIACGTIIVLLYVLKTPWR